MNSQYGKHGTKPHRKSTLCDLKTAEAMYEQAESEYLDREILRSKGIIVSEPAIKKIPTKEFPLYQIKQSRSDDVLVGCGASVRFASYITALSRCNIMRGIYACERIFGPKSIVYMDTDSIYIDVCSEWLYNQIPHLKGLFEVVSNNEQAHGRHIDMGEQASVNFSTLDAATLTEIVKNITNFKGFADMMSTSIQDPKMVHQEGSKIQFIDQNELGAFKIEYFVIDSYFLGSKQYKVTTIPAEIGESIGAAKTKIALKGVPQVNRDPEKMLRLYQKLTMHNEYAPVFQQFNVASVFKQCGAGVHIHSIDKSIRPTFSKRVHIFGNADESHPHKTIGEYEEYFNAQMEEVHRERDKFINALLQEENPGNEREDVRIARQ